ncbi:hypothetical protein [Streptomyces sp. NPDC001388]|uniref:hypothetical protein n=1 Tax=Streptomyces sp. NPDC001388 TaxID=3364568 RepID=UPI00367D5667
MRSWVNTLLEQCRCCAQGLDAKRDTPRCCAAGDCCERVPSRRTVQDARAGLVKVRSAADVGRAGGR